MYFLVKDSQDVAMFFSLNATTGTPILSHIKVDDTCIKVRSNIYKKGTVLHVGLELSTGNYIFTYNLSTNLTKLYKLTYSAIPSGIAVDGRAR